jgi:hypothetical protein
VFENQCQSVGIASLILPHGGRHRPN